MEMYTKYSETDITKLGNAIVYIAEKVKNLSKTKLLKLLFFMEDYSVKRFKTPFLGLAFEAWQAGPVIKDIFVDLSQTPTLLDKFIKREVVDGKTYITAKTSFCDDEFSANDLVVMDGVLKKYGNKTAKELVRITHEKGSLWYRTAERYDILDDFIDGKLNNSGFTLDFSDELSGCDKEFYKEQLEFLQISRSYSK